MNDQTQRTGPGFTRRDFVKTSAAAGVAATVSSALAARAFAAGDEVLRVGLVGCGGRGTGAAAQALAADSQTKLVAVGDVFTNKVESCLKTLHRQQDIAAQLQVDPEQRFVGLDAYQQVIDACDVVLLATPPGFRPQHLKAAVAAGKHIFTEKPMATDVPGVRSAMESVRVAKEKGLAMVAGFCWRYDESLRQLFARLHDGAIGELLTVYGTYLTGPVKPMPPADTRPAGITDLEWMVHNWYNFTFLCGDGLVEQACHTVDWLMWALGDVPPVSCTAVGGRQIPAEGGNIFDHIEVNYLWANGTRGFLAQRQIPGCHNENYLYLSGTAGKASIQGRNRVSIEGSSNWRFKGDSGDMYQVEHNELFASIRAGNPINDGDRMMTSTMAAIMGREAAYTGKELSWEQALASELVLIPELTDWNSVVDVRPLARPGITPFV
jgi:predicted dehydrogenase